MVRIRLFVAIWFGLVSPPTLFASQSVETRSACLVVSGVVLDTSGAPVPSADVTVTGASGQPLVAVTDSNGRFVAAPQSGPPFTVAVAVPGFAPNVQTGFDSACLITLTLSPATLAERVEVVSAVRRSALSQTATRTLTPMLDIPQTIDTVAAETLHEQAATSMSDALRNVPGVQASLGEGRRDQFLIRGFSAQTDTLLDGTRDDAPYYRDVATVERVDVVKGPAAAVFGRGSSGGVINRILKAPRPDRSISEASVTVGSLGTQRVSGDLGRALGETLSFRTAGAAEDSTSFRDGYFLKRFAVAPSLLWTGASTTALAQVEVLRDERAPDRGIPSVNGRPADVRTGQAYGFPVDDFIDTSVASGSVRVERRFARASIWRQVMRLGNYNTSFSNTAPLGTVLARQEWRVTRQQYNAEQSQQNLFSQTEVMIDARLGAVHQLMLGGVELGSQHRNTIRFTGTALPVALMDPQLSRPTYSSTASTYNVFEGTTAAVYAQNQLSVGDRWKALVGVRTDHYTQALNDRRPDDLDLSRTDVNWSPRAGVVFQPTRQTSIYGSVSRSFQPSGEGLSLAVNAADLEPEITRNVEAGFKAELFGRQATATASLFQLDRTNIKTTDPIDPGRLVLVGRQRTAGAEFAFEGHIGRRLRAQAGYAFLDAVVLRSNTVSNGVTIEGNHPALVPRHATNLWLHYILSSRVSVAGGLTSAGVRYTSNDNTVRLPGYTRADAAITYRSGPIELAINLRNVLGVRYYETASSNFQIFPGTPRDVVMTMGVRY
jgi:catecholate siderophore receptor